MFGLPFPVSALSLVLLTGGTLAADAAPLRFFAVGDVPYGPEEIPPLRKLISSALAQGTPLLIHVGDIKGGSNPCADAGLKEVADLFRAQPVPVAYTPGDNEWTDCHREKAGRLNPRDRLERVRDIFYRDPGVLRLAALGVVPPGAGGRSAAYPETYAFMQHEVMFVALHVVGSNNGYRPNDPEAVREFRQRDRFNLEFLRRASAQARSQGAKALVLFCQADPLFGQESPRGFVAFRRALVQLMLDYPGPVLLLHGDTHMFRQDHPLTDPATGRLFTRFVRVEVPGSPVVGGIWVSVDPAAQAPFSVEEVYPFALGVRP
jgi:hypothetical protein